MSDQEGENESGGDSSPDILNENALNDWVASLRSDESGALSEEGDAPNQSDEDANDAPEAADAADDDDDSDQEQDAATADTRSASKREVMAIFEKWEAEQAQAGYDPVPTLRSLNEIFEREQDAYMRKDPDPLDVRHPYRTDSSCQYGVLLKLLFRKDAFMNKLVNDYLREGYFYRQNIQRSALELNILASRLILVIMPGMETSAVFQADNDGIINRLYSWAEDSIEPLQSYATGLLAAAMDITDIAVTYREQNARLVPKMIKRLHMLLAISKSGVTQSQNNSMETASNNLEISNEPASPFQNGLYSGVGPDAVGNNSHVSILFDNSIDAFPTGGAARFYKRMYIPLNPPTADASQMLIMRFLTSLGEYQEFLAMAFENNVMQLIFGYLENLDHRDTCLAYEVLKYLASLLCHKKFAHEFILRGGVELLLKVPRPSLATTGVSIAIYYLAYCEDSMERICNMPRHVIAELVRYALWILGRCHDSAKCHATMFFSLSFQFKVILDEFDKQDGLRKLYNVISVLKILDPTQNDTENESDVNEDQDCSSRQMVRHVCLALKRYMESHFFYKYTNFLREHYGSSTPYYSQQPTVASKVTFDQIHEQIRTLQEHTSVRAHWEPVHQLMRLGVITMLLRIIAFSYDWVNTGRSETVRSALDVLSVCCVIPRVYLVLCERVQMLDKTTTSGLSSVLGAAAGEITIDAEVQKSALAVLCHCVGSPTPKKDSNLIKFGNSSRKIKNYQKYSEEILEKVWESVCSNNGIVVLLSLMQTKAPITDADCLRGMACRALAGLARSDRVRQIISKLPLFANGQLQTLMRDPILQEKRAEHVIFQKYALELLERISGKSKPLNNPLDPSLSNMHKANVIAQTRIQYNEQQLYQLIFEHLESKGLMQTAQMLQREVGLPLQTTTTRSFHQSPFDYKMLPNPISRNRLRSRMQDVNMAINNSADASMNSSLLEDSASPNVGSTTVNANGGISINHLNYQPAQTPTPIKIRKTERQSSSTGGNASAIATPGTAGTYLQRSLQKKTSSASMLGYNDVGVGSSVGLPDDLSASPALQSNRITLNTIVTEYLTNQHSLCNNPVITCPQFDLFEPHKCPDPRPNRLVTNNYNLASRHFRTQAGFNTQRFDRRHVHTHFAPWRTIRSTDYESLEFTCCEFLAKSKLVVVGTQQRKCIVFNVTDGVEQFSYNCHSDSVDTVHGNRDGDMLLTSTLWPTPSTSLWSIKENEFISKLHLNNVSHCEFSHTNRDRLLGTLNDSAALYDINNGEKISTFTPTIPNLYTKNRATLCRTDELILSDGVLWDVRSGKEIHKFDKFNQSISGVFHPNCLEIIANTEVWDLRTFHLLQTVPVLDQRQIIFSPMHVIYGATLTADRDHDMDGTTYDTSFNVLDACDYSSIATIDVKRYINDMAVNDNGSVIAVVEDHSGYDSKQETYVKLYAVGMNKNERSEEEDEEVPDSDDGSESGSGSENVFALGPNYMGFPFRSHRNGNILNFDDLSESSANNSDNEDEEDDDDDDDDDELILELDSDD